MSNKRWALALKKNVEMYENCDATKHDSMWPAVVKKVFRKFATRDAARAAAKSWPSPVYIVDLHRDCVVR